jgi:hypothetical protein
MTNMTYMTIMTYMTLMTNSAAKVREWAKRKTAPVRWNGFLLKEINMFRVYFFANDYVLCYKQNK